MNLTWTQIRFALVVGLLAAIPPVVFDPAYTYISRTYIVFLMYVALAMALNIVFGHTDQLYLFVGALTGIGAYSVAIITDMYGVSPWLLLIPCAILVGLVGALVSYVAARRQFTVIVIAILTLALQFAMIQIFTGAREYTGGTTGLRFDGLGLESVQDALGVHEHFVLFYLFLALIVGAMLFYEWMNRSRMGLAFDIIRQDEIAARSIGVNVVRYKAIAGFIAAFIIGAVGPLYAQLNGRVFPGNFEFVVIDALVLIILVLGGLRTLLGPFVGGVVVIYINDELQQLGQWRLLVFGLLLIVLFLFFRQGIVPFLRHLVDERLELKGRIVGLVRT